MTINITSPNKSDYTVVKLQIYRR